ncbi:MAG TPA: UvrD-helicase domain-containing protein [Acidimicrobiales bacterium]|nr:UvrD-helicase domain-containing protein [Acidimicrobiales bacterium]
MPHPELLDEQRHLERATAALRAMAARTTGALDAVDAATEVDAEVAAFHLRRRLESLAERDDAIAFGRIDGGGERWYVGRRHVEDDDGTPLVVDWRAPVSVPFYRATVHDPLGLDRRRRFLAEGRELLDILEEDFSDPDRALLSGGIPDPLLAELERERGGTMRDIVATIAAEQDEVIRSPLDRLLVVQGGPGTGKTAVALHRAAYLLFEHRLELLDRGVLVVGPNPLFLRYVADVLPSLGETAVRQTTIEGLRPASIRLDDSVDPDDVGRLKGDARMAEVLDRLVRDTVRVPDEPVAIGTAWGMVRLTPDDVQRSVDEVLSRRVPHATGKDALRMQLLHRAYEVHERSAEVPALKSNFVAAARTDAAFARFVDRVWPTVAATTVVQRLLINRAARRRACAGVLSPAETELLSRALPSRKVDVRWRPAEVPLLDEAEARLQGVRTTYGHVIVDEAQDLSAMALRMLARRAHQGSLTVVGDLAQATRAWGQRSWDDVVGHLRGAAAPLHAELTVGYRTPAPILDLANRLLPSAAPGVTPARSIRLTGEDPRLVAVPPAEVASAAAAAVAEAAGDRGTIAVVATAADHDALGRALDEEGVAWSADLHGPGTAALLTPLLAKGLEFDVVVVVEPARIVDAEPAGERALFVALTRPTRRLVVVHAEPLPSVLAVGAERPPGPA